MNGAPHPGPAPRRLRWVTLAVVVIATLSALYAAWREDWTYDEPIHVAWSERFLDTGEVERSSQARFNSKTTIQMASVLVRRQAERWGVRDASALRFAARLPTIAWLALLLAAVYAIVQAVFGPVAGHLATIAVALDPNLIAHGSLATNDLPFALAAWLTLGAVLAVAARPGVSTGAALGLALGLAFAAKFTAVLLAPAVVLLPLAWPSRPSRRAIARLALALATAGAVAYLVIAAAYLFRGIGEPLGGIPSRSGWMVSLAKAFPRLPSPFPTGFLTGVDFALGFESLAPGRRAAEWNTLLLGRRFPHGCWFYFGLLWLLKTPVLLALAMLAGLLAAARSGLLLWAPAGRYLAAILGVWLVYLSFFFKAQIGYRFALLCIPPAAALAAAGLALRPRPALWRAGAAVVAVALAETAFYAGNPLAFTNAAVQPKRLVFRLITDSNVDWGQNRNRIEGWLARRAPGSELDPVHVLPGHNTFSLNILAGLWDFEQHRWLREHASPGGHFGHTYLWFQVDDELYARFLAERRRLVAEPQAAERCAGVSLDKYPPGAKLDFRLEGPLAPDETLTVCVATLKGAQFGLRSVDGHARFAPLRVSSPPRPETVEKGQVAWYLLDPGTHVFTLDRIPNRRAWLPNVFEGRWMVRERGVSMAVISAKPRPAPVPPA